MDAKDYLKFCQDNYRDEFKDRDQFIPRQGFLLTGIVVLSGMVIKLATLDRLPQLLQRIDVFLYYLGMVGALSSLVTAVVLLILSLRPRTYEQLASLTEFDRWRATLREELQRSPEGYSPDEIETMIAKLTTDALTIKMNESTERNASQNLLKSKHFGRSIYAVVVALLFLALQSVATLVYHLASMIGGKV